MILVTIYDNKAETWSAPVASPSKAAAIRDFGMACRREGTVMHDCPADFDLYQVADWTDGKKPSLVVCDHLTHLSNGVDHVQQCQ